MTRVATGWTRGWSHALLRLSLVGAWFWECAYILQQIAALQRDIRRFERKYGMRFQLFGEYLRERCGLIESGDLSLEQRRKLSQAIMQEEDDWLDWKAAQEMLESWLGIRREAGI